MSLWKPQGLILTPDMIDASWYRSHVQVPVVDTYGADSWRIYFSGRDEHGRSRILYADTAKGRPDEIIRLQTDPILSFGAPGTFDDSGTMPTHIQVVGDRKFLYYIGWTPKVTVPYQNSIGVVEVTGDGYKKLFDGPVIGMDETDPCFAGTFYCLPIGDQLAGYYLSTNGWVNNPGTNKLEPLYDIKSAFSNDGMTWTKTGKAAIPLMPDEGGLASASVIRWKDKYLMWYARRGKFNYRDKTSTDNYDIGFAISNDGTDWKRMDALHGLPQERGHWDSEMRSYPYVVVAGETLYLFYNGNGFGQTGIGYATCTADELDKHLSQLSDL